MTTSKMGRTLTQDTWKRTQVRLPQVLYDEIFEYAENQGISLNQAIIDLTNKGLASSPTDQTNLLTQILTEIQASKKAP